MDGKLIYEINEADKTQIMLLVYRTKDDIIITDQPSHPGKKKQIIK